MCKNASSETYCCCFWNDKPFRWKGPTHTRSAPWVGKFPGGQVEEGENLIEALQREIKEESGVTASIGSLVGVYSNIKTPTKVMFGFLGKYVSGELITSEESLQTEWVTRHSALQRVSNPIVYDRMKDMLDFSGQVIYRSYTSDPYHVCKQCFL